MRQIDYVANSIVLWKLVIFEENIVTPSIIELMLLNFDAGDLNILEHRKTNTLRKE